MQARPPTTRVLWLVTGLLSAGVPAGCGVSGPPSGGPLPQMTDLHAVALTGSTVLAAPAGWTPAPTIITPVFAVGAPDLFATMKDLLLAEPRTWLTVSYPQGQAFFIVRSIFLNLPDIVIAQAIPVTDTTSRAVILSQSRYDITRINLPIVAGNMARVRHLVDALTSRLGTVPPSTPKP